MLNWRDSLHKKIQNQIRHNRDTQRAHPARLVFFALETAHIEQQNTPDHTPERDHPSARTPDTAATHTALAAIHDAEQASRNEDEAALAALTAAIDADGEPPAPRLENSLVDGTLSLLGWNDEAIAGIQEHRAASRERILHLAFNPEEVAKRNEIAMGFTGAGVTRLASAAAPQAGRGVFNAVRGLFGSGGSARAAETTARRAVEAGRQTLRGSPLLSSMSMREAWHIIMPELAKIKNVSAEFFQSPNINTEIHTAKEILNNTLNFLQAAAANPSAIGRGMRESDVLLHANTIRNEAMQAIKSLVETGAQANRQAIQPHAAQLKTIYEQLRQISF